MDGPSWPSFFLHPASSILMLPGIADLLSAKKYLSRKLLCRVSQEGDQRCPAERPCRMNRYKNSIRSYTKKLPRAFQPAAVCENLREGYLKSFLLFGWNGHVDGFGLAVIEFFEWHVEFFLVANHENAQ